MVTGSFTVDTTTDQATANLFVTQSNAVDTIPFHLTDTESMFAGGGVFGWGFNDSGVSPIVLGGYPPMVTLFFSGTFTGQTIMMDNTQSSSIDGPGGVDPITPMVTLTATATPEPFTGTIVLLGTIGLVGGARYRRYRSICSVEPGAWVSKHDEPRWNSKPAALVRRRA